LRVVWLLLFWFVLTTSLFSGVNILKKVEVRNKELHLIFDAWINKNNIKKMTLNNPPRVVVDIKNSRLANKHIASNLSSAGVKSFRISQYRKSTVRIVIETYQPYNCKHYQPMSSRAFYHISLPSRGKGTTIATIIGDDTPRSTPKREKVVEYSDDEYDNSSDDSFVASLFNGRSKSTKKTYTIVVDAGHGGKDSGAVGTRKHYEKTVVLQIAKRVTKYLKAKGFKVKMTRTKDRFIKLKNRTRFANRHHADIFVSIHANAVSRKSRSKIVHGVETYFLQNSRSARAARVAAKENSVVLDKNDRLSNNVILNTVLSGPKLVQSHKLAIDIQKRVISNLKKSYKGVNNGGVKPAPFWVLVGAQMPSVLVEVGYITHPRERARLFTPAYQDKLAKGVAEGVSNYLVNREKDID